RLARLKAWRQAHGKRLALDPALLWPARSLERLARAPDTLGAEQRSSDVRRWQAAELGASLRELLDG
ncbi:MAG: ribonuclease D, partial [Chloroflexi bacterium]|nr:ribonuclease D [Chloroflexota bacterium]